MERVSAGFTSEPLVKNIIPNNLTGGIVPFGAVPPLLFSIKFFTDKFLSEVFDKRTEICYNMQLISSIDSTTSKY